MTLSDKLLNISLYAAALLAAGFIVHEHYIMSQEMEKQAHAVINMPAYVPQAKEPNVDNRAQYLHGLFGNIEIKNDMGKVQQSKVIEFGPKSLEGVFIRNGQAWAIVTDQKNQAKLIYPESITSYTQTSITFKSRLGVKSLHIKENDTGMDIRRVNLGIAHQGDQSKKPILSRAAKIRKAMLEKTIK